MTEERTVSEETQEKVNTLRIVRDEENEQESIQNESEGLYIPPKQPTEELPKTEPTAQQKILSSLEQVCRTIPCEMKDIAHAMGADLQKQIRLLDNERNFYQTQRKTIRERVEYKKLVAEEVVADKTIDGHKREMQEFQNSLIGGVTQQLMLTAVTEEQKAMVKKVAELFGFNYMEIINANKKIIEEEAKKLALKEINTK